MKLLAYSLLLVFAMNSMDKCDKDMEEFEVDLGETFELELNKTAEVEGEKLGITFSKKQDSRCPLEVNCIQAGKATATLQLISKGGTEEVKLEVKGLCHKEDGSCGESKTAGGYNIKLISINPYPGSEGAHNNESVKAKLVISKQ